MESVGTSLYEKIGGSEKLTELVRAFYRIMETDPNAKECFATHHGRDIAQSAEKLSMFLSGITGGPQLYQEKFGHPRLRMRHFPFSISDKEAGQWLYCMLKAMDEVGIAKAIQEDLIPYFRQVTAHLRNR